MATRTIPVYAAGMRPGETVEEAWETQIRDGLEWRIYGHDDLTTEEIIGTLNDLGIDVSAETFRELAIGYPSIDALIEDWASLFPEEDLWQDYTIGGAITLWKRLAPDVLRYDLIVSYLHDIDKFDLRDPDLDTAACMAKLNAIADFLEPFSDDEKSEQFERIQESSTLFIDVVVEGAIHAVGPLYPDEIFRLAGILAVADIRGGAYHVQALIDTFAGSNRLRDVQPLVDDLVARRPGQFSANQAAWMLATELGDDARRVEYAIASLNCITKRREWDQWMANLTEMFVEEGRSDLLNIVVERTVRPVELNYIHEDVDRRPKSQPVTVKHVGRNDPCPCGSGKKYKKCHGK